MTHDEPASDMRQMTGLGRSIENSSFDIVDSEAGEHTFDARSWEVVRRVIHATADFEFKELMHISEGAVDAGIAALKSGTNIIVDVRMISAGVNQQRLDVYGCKIQSFISDDDVIATAKEKNTTRAIESIRKAHQLGLLAGSIIAIGNAPTALLEVVRFIKEENVKPALIIGVPVGFVSAAESKEAVLETDVPCIVARGRKGGSPIAVSVLHALLLLSSKESS